MSSSSRKPIAMLMISAGVIILAANFFREDGSDIFWPLVLVLVGLWFIFGPSVFQNENFKLRFITNIQKYGNWQVKSQEMLAFVHDVDYDLTNAHIPKGETKITLMGFVTELNLRLPEDVGFSVTTNAFVTESKINEEKQEFLMRGMKYTSPNYESSERKIHFEINSFVVELSARS